MDTNNPLPPFFYEIFDASLPRLGPGDADTTRKAIQLALASLQASNLPSGGKIRALDIGCGNGTQTIELAKHLDGTILAVDNHQPFLDELQRRAEAAGVSEKIEARLGDMHNLGLDESSFDLIWSEGAFFVMGIGNALEMCHRLLKPGGVLGMSDLFRFKPDPPERCEQFLNAECGVLTDVDTALAMMADSGYEVLDHSSLPESAWWDSFFHPLADRLRALREKQGSDPEKLALIESIEHQIEIYRDYSSYYGYEFFLLLMRSDNL